MCGIVGLTLTHESVTACHIAAMCRTIVHRGPDGDGRHIEQNVGIGMQRLAIIDVDGGWQPIANERGDIHVVQNGEIYNYRALRKQLELLGHTFKTQSDTEVVVHAYEEWGGFEFAQKLRGMFGIAIWDATQRELWLVRDRLGIKPLYYAKDASGFVFASELKALLASPIVRAEVEPRALSEYLTYGSADIDRSFIKGVQQLEPGCLARLRVDRHDLQLKRYWQFGFPESRMQLSKADAADALEEKLRESVRLHLTSDVPVGAFLSGGVDSSTIVAMASQLGGGKLHTFSIGFEDDRFNELPYAREVAKQYGCDHHERIVRPNAIDIIDQLIFHLDEPFADASAIPTWYVSQLASEHVKVVLSGDGGDELFAGYDRFSTAHRSLTLDRLPRIVRRFGARMSDFLPSIVPGKYFLSYAALDAVGRYASEHCLFPLALQKRLLLPDLDPMTWGEPHPVCRSMDLLQSYNASDYLSTCQQFETNRYLPMDILVKVDRMTMAHSLEARPPFLDHELVEFAASLPSHLKFRPPNHKKIVLQDVARRHVPRHLVERKKAGFAVPLQAWFAGPLLPMFEDLVVNHGKVAEFLNLTEIRNLVAENKAGRRDHGLKLWSILVLELWLRRILDRVKSTAVGMTC